MVSLSSNGHVPVEPGRGGGGVRLRLGVGGPGWKCHSRPGVHSWVTCPDASGWRARAPEEEPLTFWCRRGPRSAGPGRRGPQSGIRDRLFRTRADESRSALKPPVCPPLGPAPSERAAMGTGCGLFLSTLPPPPPPPPSSGSLSGKSLSHFDCFP